MYGKVINSKDGKDEYDKKIFEQFKKILEPNNFKNALKSVENSHNVITESILSLITNIHNSLENIDNYEISDLFQKHFINFVHNRIGTLLTKMEKDNIQENTLIDVDRNIGKLVPYMERNDVFKWCILMKRDTDTGRVNNCYILLKNDNDSYERKSVTIGSLKNYLSNEPILPNNSSIMKFDENNIYETYYFD